MTEIIYPPDWHFSERSHVNHIVIGDLFPVVMFGAGDKIKCLNCMDQEFVYCREITRSGPLHWIGNRRFHSNLRSAPCPVCRGDYLGEWLSQNCGLLGMELNDKPALEITIVDVSPSKGQEDAFQAAWNLLAELPMPKTWALFSGEYGRGKTHILAGLVNACRVAGVYALYSKSETILSELKDTFTEGSTKTTDQVRRKFESVPVLVVDELDRVKWTEWAGEQLFAILNARYDRGRPAWFASNLGPTALSEKAEPLAALVSRLSAGIMVAVGGADLRPQQQGALNGLVD